MTTLKIFDMNLMSLQKSFLYFSVMLLIGCKIQPVENINAVGGGVAITFDDNFIDEWYDIHNILKEYNWRATFFVSNFHQLDSSKIEKLNILKEYGHEIGGHGLNHVNAKKYVLENGITSYLENEIYPMKQIMAENGFHVTSFAYPFGAKNNKIDVALLNEFKMIRGTTAESWKLFIKRRIEKLTCRSCFPNLLYGIGIDYSPEIDMPYIKSLMKKAKDKNKVAVFFAHETVEKVDNDYQITYQRLIEICEYINENKMKFLLITDLHEK